MKTYHIAYEFTWFALQKCGNVEDAEDLIQEVAINAFLNSAKIKNLNQKEKRNYIMRTIHNEYVDMVRYRNRTKRIMCKNLPSKTNPEAYAKIELKELRKKAEGNIACQTFFIVESGYTNKEVAEMTGERLATILSRCYRARKYLRA